MNGILLSSFLDDLTGLIAILSAVALPIGFGMYLGLRGLNTRHKERMELIRQGIVPPNEKMKPTPNRYRSLRNGFICIGIALGLLLGVYLQNTYEFEEGGDFFALGASVLFFLGLAYILFYVITRNKNDLDNEIE